MTKANLKRIAVNSLAVLFALCGLACAYFAFILFKYVESDLGYICTMELVIFSVLLIVAAMLCRIAARMDKQAAREERLIEILQDIEAELTRQGKAAYQG